VFDRRHGGPTLWHYGEDYLPRSCTGGDVLPGTKVSLHFGPMLVKDVSAHEELCQTSRFENSHQKHGRKSKKRGDGQQKGK
jgi:hypothetical protein